MTQHRSRPLLVAIVGTVLVVAYAALAAVQILILNPLAAAPGRTLAQIHTDMDAAGESVNNGMTIGILAVGVLLAVVVLIATVAGSAVSAVGTTAIYLTLLVAGALGYFAASFGWGISLADTYGISGADYSPWALPLYAVSLLALAGLAIIALALALNRRVRRPLPA